MQDLNFPSYTFRLKNSENNIHIFDVIRKKFVLLQPEEWVRQHCIHFLTNEKKYPISLINVEKVVHINGLNKRYDVVVYNPDGSIHLHAQNISFKHPVNEQKISISAPPPPNDVLWVECVSKIDKL